MTKFEINESYEMKSVCDQNCKWQYKVVGLTAKTVKLQDEDGIIKSFRIKEYGNSEFVRPLGTYSMCPSLRAENKI